MRVNLKILRVKNKLSQVEMAEKIGFSRSMYNAVETGKRDGSKLFWQSVQTTFGIPDSEMWCLQKCE